jgi:hypothetical protein
VNEELVKLFAEMAAMTKAKCKDMAGCKGRGHCCGQMFCEDAREFAKKHGVELKDVPKAEQQNNLPFCGPKGCVVPPHFRVLCSLHQCKIASIGYDAKDPKWTKKYFKLRARLEALCHKEKWL